VGARLTYEHALGRRAQRGAHAAATGRLARATIGIADAELQVAAAVVEAVSVAETAARRIEISERAIDLAERNIEAEVARFELGRSTNFDVLERQDELKQSQLRYARAGVDYVSSLAQLEALTGDLLERYGISLEVR
jgi:outer membrane protein